MQPLGQDLQHTPTITQPKQRKTRFSDQAREKSSSRVANQRKHVHRHKVKVDNAKPTALTAGETANQKVQSAPLGLSGDTVHKKKKKKVKVKNGEKSRLSDEKKASKKKEVAPVTDNSSSTSSGDQPAAQPQ